MKVRVRVILAFEDWQKDGQSIYYTEEGIVLTSGDFHSGTCFDAEIKLTKDNVAELKKAIDNGCLPVFVALLP